MNILYLINFAGKGGTEKYIKILASHFRKGHNIHFIYHQAGPLCGEMKKLNVSPTQIVMKSPIDLAAAKQIGDYCKNNNIHLIHTQFQRENYIAVLAKYFVPHIKVINTSHINMENNLIWKFSNQLMGEKDDAIIAVCTWGKELLIQNKMPPNKIRVIFNGVDANRLLSPKEQQLREQYQDLSNQKIPFCFVTLTRFTPEKGTRFLLESIVILRAKTKRHFRVIFVGDGPLLDEDKRFALNNGLMHNVLFAGYRKDASEILAAAHVFINSSESEALSFAILEAMSLGLPIIATDQGGNRDIINPERRCGLLTPYGDTHGMADAMLQIMEYPRPDYALNSRKAIETTFNIEKTLRETQNLYESVT